VLVVGAILAIVLLPSRRRLEELHNPPPAPAPAATQALAETPAVPAYAAVGAPAQHHELRAIPVALMCCSPVTRPIPVSTATSPQLPRP
jgi:hypothetical protein